MCQEDCADHSTICTTCGSPLQSSASVRVVPPELEQQVRYASQNLSLLLSNLRTQVRELQMRVDETGQTIAGIQAITEQQQQQQWQQVPAEAMDPQAASSTSRPTAKAILDSLPRITLETGSFLFHQATLVIENRDFAAALGEFGPTSRGATGTLVVCDPLTGLGGFSSKTQQALGVSTKTIAYLERGDGLTFVKKALLAQEAGAGAVVIGNHTPEPWPYIMKDSKGEASSLKIPVVMVKQANGHALFGLDGKECCLEIHATKMDCVICREVFEKSQTVIQLPTCGHAFHEDCALTWLTRHNSCPYCRRELATDDVDYEQERRRTQRTHAGSTTTSSSSEWNDFYG